MKLRKTRQPTPIGPGGVRTGSLVSPLRSSACDIAVSEMTGVPLDDMCGWILVTVDHTMPGAHRSLLMQGCQGVSDDEWAANWLEQVAADLREAL